MVSKSSETAFISEKYNKFWLFPFKMLTWYWYSGFLPFKFSEDGFEEQVCDSLAQVDAALALTRYRLIVDLSFEGYGPERQDVLIHLSSHIYNQVKPSWIAWFNSYT